MVTVMSPAKTTELIHIPFRAVTQVGQRNRVRWRPRSSKGRGIFGGGGSGSPLSSMGTNTAERICSQNISMESSLPRQYTSVFL